MKKKEKEIFPIFFCVKNDEIGSLFGMHYSNLLAMRFFALCLWVSVGVL